MEEEKINEEPERHYLSIHDLSKWKMDWNMLLFQPEDQNGFELDWNKLIYNDEQMAEFNLQKQERMIQPDKYEYLFENPTQRSPLELYYLKMAGYDVEEIATEKEEDNEVIVKRLIIQDKLTSC